MEHGDEKPTKEEKEKKKTDVRWVRGEGGMKTSYIVSNRMGFYDSLYICRLAMREE